jgi:hypothetical protein
MIANWFKNKKEDTTIQAVVKQEKVITSKDIQEDLHKSFQDVLAEFGLKESKETEIESLEESLKIFRDKNKEVIDKIKVLKDLNLTSTPSVTKSLEVLIVKEREYGNEIFKIKEQIRKSENIKRLSEEYSLKYPCYKFIDDKTMFKIMEKYDLVLGEAFMYGREIPTENLSIIANFTKEIKESEKTLQLISRHFSRSVDYSFIEKPKVEIIEKTAEDLDFRFMRMSSNDTRIEREFKVSKFKIIAPESHFTVPTYETYTFDFDKKNVELLEVGKDRKYTFSVKSLNDIEAKKREVLDPIACLEVDGGYIVMTAWDKEAEIPEIKNTFLN